MPFRAYIIVGLIGCNKTIIWAKAQSFCFHINRPKGHGN